MEVKDIFKWGSAVFAVLPGLGVLLASIGLPPGYPRVLCSAVVEAIGVFTLIYLRGRRTPSARGAIFFLCSFVVLLLVYLYLFNTRVVYNLDYDTSIFFPLWYSNDLSNLIAKSGGRNAAISAYGPEAIRSVIADSPSCVEGTNLLLFFLYILLLESLILALGLIGFSIPLPSTRNDHT